jgi:hypothetical protein
MEEIEIQQGMVCANLTDGSLPSENCTANSQQTLWRGNGTVTPLPDPMPSPTRKLPALPGEHIGGYCAQIDSLLPGYLYISTRFPNAIFSKPNAYAQDPKHYIDFIPNLLMDEGISTG